MKEEEKAGVEGGGDYVEHIAICCRLYHRFCPCMHTLSDTH